MIYQEQGKQVLCYIEPTWHDQGYVVSQELGIAEVRRSDIVIESEADEVVLFDTMRITVSQRQSEPTRMTVELF